MLTGILHLNTEGVPGYDKVLLTSIATSGLLAVAGIVASALNPAGVNCFYGVAALEGATLLTSIGRRVWHYKNTQQEQYPEQPEPVDPKYNKLIGEGAISGEMDAMARYAREQPERLQVNIAHAHLVHPGGH